MKMYFKTRKAARDIVKNSGKQAPRKKDDNGKWAVNLK